ncbi:MAG: hypothetical protein ACFB0Z_06835 [Candidatus Phaeomarinobacter sp.]
MSKDGTHTAIWGSTNTGKSTLARHVLTPMPAAVVVDPVGDWKRAKGWRQATSLKQVASIMKASWSKGFHIAYEPPSGSEALALHHLSNMLWGAQADYFASKNGVGHKIGLGVDEMSECYSQAHSQTAALPGFKRLVLKGRHAGIEIVGISQFPQDVATRFRSNAATTHCFALYEPAGVAAMKQKVGRDADRIGQLKRFHYLTFSEGKVTENVTKKSR